ncbi:MAG: aminotransferase class IV [Thermodesulfobacteriota bacterium]
MSKERRINTETNSRILEAQEAFCRLQEGNYEHQQNYLAMYSSWLGGIVLDPQLMLVPVDDHLVHRGDGIFEAFKCVQGKVYLLERHLDRLERSANLIDLALPTGREQLQGIILETIRAAGALDCLVRLFVSRGPGDFTPSPSSCLGSQLYIVITSPARTDAEKYKSGCSLISSKVPIKPGFLANVKSCNYLPNVLMEKEAEDRGADFTAVLDESGYLAEGPTENLGLISKDNEFLVPDFERTLQGTTVVRMLELAESMVQDGALQGARQAKISARDVLQAREVMMFGTTFDVLPVVSFEGHSIGQGKPGQMFQKFLRLMLQDQQQGLEVLSPA